MLGFMAAVSRYYFVFLMGYFLWLGYRGLFRDEPRPSLGIAVLLLPAFAFPILAFSDAAFAFSPQTLLFGGALLVFVLFGGFLLRRVHHSSCAILEKCMFFLLSIGLVMLYRLSPSLALRQLVFAALGFGIALLIPLVFRIFKQIERLEIVFLLTSFGLLGLVHIAELIDLIFNIQIPIVAVDQFGANRWIRIGPINFQPSEFVKILYVLYLACAFRAKPSLGKIAFVGAASAGLILMLVAQRNLGHALVFFGVFMAMLYAASASRILFGLGLLAMGGASVLSYQLFPHLRIRVAAWQNPWADIADGGFQIAQSLFAIGSPGAFGAGLGLGMPERIPVVERDMIFSAISEEFGWIFALGIMAVFALILARSMQIASRQSRPLYGMMAMGFSVLIGFQAFIAIGGNVKFIPMTGITLPLMSYGGSSVFVIMLMFGFLQTFNRINDEGTEPDE